MSAVLCSRKKTRDSPAISVAKDRQTGKQGKLSAQLCAQIFETRPCSQEVHKSHQMNVLQTLVSPELRGWVF